MFGKTSYFAKGVPPARMRGRTLLAMLMCLCLAICGGLLTTTASAADDNYKITVHALNPSENAPKLPDPTG